MWEAYTLHLTFFEMPDIVTPHSLLRSEAFVVIASSKIYCLQSSHCGYLTPMHDIDSHICDLVTVRQTQAYFSAVVLFTHWTSLLSMLVRWSFDRCAAFFFVTMFIRLSYSYLLFVCLVSILQFLCICLSSRHLGYLSQDRIQRELNSPKSSTMGSEKRIALQYYAIYQYL